MFRIWLLTLGLIVAAGGCQHRPAFPYAPVEGTILKGGQPLAEVEVIFFGDPDAGTVGPRASGVTDKDGRYRLQGDVIRSVPRNPDGAVVGFYYAVVETIPVPPPGLQPPPLPGPKPRDS